MFGATVSTASCLQQYLLVEGLLVFDDLDGHNLASVLPHTLDHLAKGSLAQQLLHDVPEPQC